MKCLLQERSSLPGRKDEAKQGVGAYVIPKRKSASALTFDFQDLHPTFLQQYLMLTIPDYPFKAFIFDCDGTLVDSMPIHYEAWVEALDRYNAPFDFTEEVFYGYAGVREQDVVEALNQAYESEVDGEAVAKAKAEIFLSRVAEVKAVKPVADFARSLAGRYSMAVASGSEEKVVRSCLTANGLIDLFATIVTPADVEEGRGKPAPDMFLLAAERLGVEPKDCLVLEDGHSGIVAAEAAGMQSIFIPRTLR